MFGNSNYQVAGPQALIQKAIDQLKGSPPSDLDTLQELATAINDDPAFAATIISMVVGKINTSSKGQPNGVAELDGSGIVPDAQLPVWQRYKLTEINGDAQTGFDNNYDTYGNTGIFGLNDGSSGTMSNAPSGFSSSSKAILIVWNFSSEKQQTLVDLATRNSFTRSFQGFWQSWQQEMNYSIKGQNNGVAELDSGGIVPDSQLPAWQRYKLTDNNGDSLSTILNNYDSLTSPGIYKLSDGSSVTMINPPSTYISSSAAVITVWTAGSSVCQSLVNLASAAVYVRVFNGSVWTSW